VKVGRLLMKSVPLALIAMAVGASGAAAKCQSSNVLAGGPPPPSYLIDGVPVDVADFNELNPAVILQLTLVCRELRDPLSGALVAEETVVWVLTKTGYEQGVRHLLADLVAAQADFHAKEGRFAGGEDLPRLLRGFFGDASQRLTLTGSGWSASFGIIMGGTSHATCHVAVGGIDLPHPGLVPGIPACFLTESQSVG